MKQPLTGKTVLVTRAARQSSKFSELLQQQGAKVVEMPALEIRPPSSWVELDRAIAHLDDFHWLILTSSNGVEYFYQRLTNCGKSERNLANIKIAVVGKKTATSLRQQGGQPNFIPPDFIADSLVEHFPEALAGKKILFPRVETGGRELLVQELTNQGAEVVEVPAYQSGCPEQIAPEALETLQKQTVDFLTFASGKTVNNFCKLLANVTPELLISSEKLLANVCIASIGPQTSQSCRQLLGRVDLEAQEYTLEGLTQAILDYVENQSFARHL
ncbi:uroporphyrinogen-III synthase [Oscillatoria salina]|uniref:uroporphyrinogen-III synthase n=1 Tax=Oscillatoria salina TaxID=331517 RepID=UPI001CCAE774|nr:uroporphyrinogen-III synthase [Oscillatoria salina]